MRFRRCVAVVLLLAVLGTLGNPLRAQPGAAADGDLDADLQKIVADVKAGKMAALVDRLYTPYVNARGGAAAMKAQEAQAETVLAGQGLKIMAFSFIKPYQSVNTGVREYRIIPAFSVMAVGLRRTEIRTFWLAIRAPGATGWQFLDGQVISRPDARAALFPDLKDTPLPPVQVLN